MALDCVLWEKLCLMLLVDHELLLNKVSILSLKRNVSLDIFHRALFAYNLKQKQIIINFFSIIKKKVKIMCIKQYEGISLTRLNGRFNRV